MAKYNDTVARETAFALDQTNIMNTIDGKKFKKVSKYPSWVTPEVIAYYESKDGNKQARLTYGLVGEDLDLWGVEIADVINKEMLNAQAFDNANSALNWLKTKLK